MGDPVVTARRALPALSGALLACAVAAESPAPVPEAARGPAVPPQRGYLRTDLGNGAHWLTDGHYQMLFIVTGSGVVAVDAPPSLDANILTAIAEVTAEPVTHVVYSHFHKDHIGAAHRYPEDAHVIAHAQTARLLAEANDPKRPLPDLTFEDRHAFTVGATRVELSYPGPNHDLGNIIVHVPAARLAMMVDVVWPGWVPFHSIGVADHIPGIFRAMDALLALDFDTFVGGHANRVGTRRDIEIQKAYLEDVRAAAAAAYEAVGFDEILETTGWDHRWHLFGIYFDRLAAYCNERVAPKWQGRLGDADRFTAPNCMRMAFSLWMD
jgi:glyoxylase-like metal-dependent hydrolase (beta-lactamase superfamily II)